MVCVVCSCCATSPNREVCGLREGLGVETLCHDIYPARPITSGSDFDFIVFLLIFFCSGLYFSFYCYVLLVFVLPSGVIKNDNHCFSGS